MSQSKAEENSSSIRDIGFRQGKKQRRINKRINIPVIRHLVHEAVLHGLRSPVIDSILSLRCEIIGLLNLFGPNTLRNADHPQELVDIIAGVPNQTAEDDKYVVYIVFPENRIRDLF
jgi:hypothetical protein